MVVEICVGCGDAEDVEVEVAVAARALWMGA